GGLFLWDDTSRNLGLGRSSLESVTGTATSNTALGRGALANTTAGGTSTDGSNNTAVGAFALTGNMTGFVNTATGFLALYSNTTGYGNTASGALALFKNETGGKNTANGNSALFSNSSGGANTAIGYLALAANLSGFNNTAIGYGALYSNDGGDNTANGYRALFANTTGFRNTATGAYALHDNEVGYRNTALGHSSLESNTSGVHNTAVGDSALFFNGAGDRNVAVGFTAGFDAPAGGSDNIFIGSTGDAGDSTPTIRIGEDGIQTRAFVAGIDSNTVSGSTVQVTSVGELGVASSSRRFKEGIDDLDGIAERLFELRPVTFRYRPELVSGAGDTEIGLIAEEVAEIFPELVTRDEEGDPFGVRYELLGVLLLHELQRQHAVIEEQGRVLEEMAALRERVKTLERGTDLRGVLRRDPGRDRAVLHDGSGRDPVEHQ
ncbi:MAG: tail fiber domain-containing protein, partial [Halobacteriales archaeon]|nr:tail fiber domain-containing protein [Halobacteriales archaeon]